MRWVVKDFIGYKMEVKDEKSIGKMLFVDFFFMNSINMGLRRIFQKYGKVIDVFILKKLRRGSKIRFGFVIYVI